MSLNIEQLGLSIKGSRMLRDGFEQSLSRGDSSFVPKPTQLQQIERARRTLIERLQEENKRAEAVIATRAENAQQVIPSTNRLKALDLAVKSIRMESILETEGALYGEKAFNFCVTDLALPKMALDLIQTTAEEAYSTLTTCMPFDSTGTSVTESYFESLGAKPNGARVDIILTDEGPKVIEINTQWVDAIQALEAFQVAYIGQKPRQSGVDMLGQKLRGRSIAIVDITKGAGSRKLGAKGEIDRLALNLQKRNYAAEVDIVDPRKVLPSYLDGFDSFYINGEPRMIQDVAVPEWAEVIGEKIKRSSSRVYPLWNPLFDRKRLLIEASQKNLSFTPTLPFSQDGLERIQATGKRVVLKGDGYSSNSIAIERTDTFERLLNDALLASDSFVLQPKLDSASLPPIVGFDTSSQQFKYLNNPNCKFNVWIINNKVAGILASVSDRDIISDKDFNVIPKVK